MVLFLMVLIAIGLATTFGLMAAISAIIAAIATGLSGLAYWRHRPA
jgi:hypothetical protein